MDVINSWITAMSCSGMTDMTTTCLLVATATLLIALITVMHTLNKAVKSLLTVKLTSQELEKQVNKLEEMLIATKFLTLRPEVFADEHETKTTS